MSDLKNRLERISFIISDLRDGTNCELVAECLGELENIQRKIPQTNLLSSLETKDNQLLQYYEQRCSQAERIILKLEGEIEEMRFCDNFSSQQENSNVLAERSVFWKDQSNMTTPQMENTPPREYMSPKTMKSLLVDMELKSLSNEKENECYKSQIKQLENLNAQYDEKIEELSNQLQEVLKNERSSEVKIIRLSEEKINSSAEISRLKSELEMFKKRIKDTEKDLQLKISSNLALETKTKILEEKNKTLVAAIHEIFKENENLTSEKREFEEKFQITYEEIKEKAILYRPSPEQRKILISFNNLVLKSPNSHNKSFATPQRNSSSHPNSSQVKVNEEDSSKYYKRNLVNISRFQDKVEDDDKIEYNTLEEVLQLSDDKVTYETEMQLFSTNDLCRQELSEKARSGLSQIPEEEFTITLPPGPISNRVITAKVELKCSQYKKGKQIPCVTTACNIF